MTRINCMVLVIMVLAPPAADAKVTLIEVTGVFEDQQSEDETGLNTFSPLQGQTLSFIYEYDSDVPDSKDDVINVGQYFHPIPTHRMSLASGAVSLAMPPNYRLVANDIVSNNPEYYVVADRSPLTSVTGLTLPDEFQAIWFGISHEVSASALEFLGDLSGNNPLPEPPFFLDEPTTNAVVFVTLGIRDSQTDQFLTESINASVTSIRAVPEPTALMLLAVSVITTCLMSQRGLRMECRK